MCSSTSAVSGSPSPPSPPSQSSSSVASASATAAVPVWSKARGRGSRAARVGAARWSEAEHLAPEGQTRRATRIVLVYGLHGGGRAQGPRPGCSASHAWGSGMPRLTLDLTKGGRLAARASRAHDGHLELPLILPPAQPRVASRQRALRVIPVLVVERLLAQHLPTIRLDALPKCGRIAGGELSLHLNGRGAGHAAAASQRGSEQQRAQRGGGRRREPH